jgi:hypothetical protein
MHDTLRNGVRIGGIYHYRGGTYEVIELSTPEQEWRSVGLMGHPFHGLESDILYVQEDGSIIDIHFQAVGTIADLTEAT